MSTSYLLRLAGLVFVAVSFVVAGDVAGKLLMQSGVHPFFVAFSRFAIGALLVLPVSGLKVSEVYAFARPPLLARAALIAVGICAILTALRSEPIANVFGAFFIGPIVAYVLAAVFLRERVSLARTILLGVGFCGVMLVIRPGFGMSIGLFFALIAGLCYGGYLVMTKWMAGDVRPRLLLLSQLVIGAVILSPVLLFVPLPTLDPRILWLILGSAAGSALGNYLLVTANRIGEASLIAPLVYSQLISATLASVLVFGDRPDAWTLLGLAVIFCSGVATLWVTRRQTS